MKTHKILLSSFEPFGSIKTNCSEIIAEQFIETSIEGVDFHHICLPVSFENCWPKLEQEILKVDPDIILSLGQSTQREKICLERVALNLIDTQLADNDGVQPVDEVILEAGPNAHFTSLPIKPMFESAKVKNLPIQISNSAGTYVCNYLMYKLLDYAHSSEIPAGFIHLPLLPQQNQNQFPTVSSEQQMETLSAIILTLSELKSESE